MFRLDYNPEDEYRCIECENKVTQQFARVFGDNYDNVYGCPECTTYRELANEQGGAKA